MSEADLPIQIKPPKQYLATVVRSPNDCQNMDYNQCPKSRFEIINNRLVGFATFTTNADSPNAEGEMAFQISTSDGVFLKNIIKPLSFSGQYKTDPKNTKYNDFARRPIVYLDTSAMGYSVLKINIYSWHNNKMGLAWPQGSQFTAITIPPKTHQTYVSKSLAIVTPEPKSNSLALGMLGLLFLS